MLFLYRFSINSKSGFGQLGANREPGNLGLNRETLVKKPNFLNSSVRETSLGFTLRARVPKLIPKDF